MDGASRYALTTCGVTGANFLVQTRANLLLSALECSIDGRGGLGGSSELNSVGFDALVLLLRALKRASNAR